MSADSLRPADIALHERLGIGTDLLAAAGVRRLDDRDAREIFGGNHRGDLAGIVYPRFHPTSGQPRGYRIRRDHPEIEAGKPKNKYLANIDRASLFFAPGAGPLLAAMTLTVVLVESEKAALALTGAARRADRPLLPIALGGVWGWKGRIGKTTSANGSRVDEHGPLPDLDLVTWTNRDVVILFDGNVASRPDLRSARRALASELTTRGAKVRTVDLPIEPDVNGPDDFIAKHGDAAQFAIIDGARSIQPESAEDVLLWAGLDDLRSMTAAALEAPLRRLKEELEGADALRRRTVREIVVAGLKGKVSGAAALVDAAIYGVSDPSVREPALDFLAEDEPWPHSVDGIMLLDETVTCIRRYVVLTSTEADALALWIAASHTIAGLQRMPMLLVSSNAPECGKTTAATLVSGLVPRPVMVSSLTPAVLFRLIDGYKPTLIADEADSWLNDEKSELRGVFNSAHWRSGAWIPRCVGDDHEIRLFNVFGAKVLAMIGRPPTTMLSRCIMIVLHRKTTKERVEPLREERLRADVAHLRQRYRRWTMDHIEKLGAYEPTMPADLPANRPQDNWRPLLAIAELAGGDWPARARAAALALSGVRVAEDETTNVALLADVRNVFRARYEPEYLSSDEIVAALNAETEWQWSDWNRGRGISVAQFANRVRGFGTGPQGLRTRKTRLNAEKTGQRWHQTDFIDAWARYLPEDTPSDRSFNPEHPEHTNESGPQLANSNPEQGGDVPGPKTRVQPMFTDVVPDVPASEPKKRARVRV